MNTEQESNGVDSATNGLEHRFLQKSKEVRVAAAELRASDEECAYNAPEHLDLLETEASTDEAVLFFGLKKRQVVALEKIATVLQTFLDMVSEGMINKLMPKG